MNVKKIVEKSYQSLVDETSRLLKLVPVDVEKMNFSPNGEDLVLHDLIKHVQQLELRCMNGVCRGEFSVESIPWHVGQHNPMVDQLHTNHRQAMDLLSKLDDSDLLSKSINFPGTEEVVLLEAITQNLSHISARSTQLAFYLKELGEEVPELTLYRF